MKWRDRITSWFRRDRCKHENAAKEVIHMDGGVVTGSITAVIVPRDIEIFSCYECMSEKVGYSDWQLISEGTGRQRDD